MINCSSNKLRLNVYYVDAVNHWVSIVADPIGRRGVDTDLFIQRIKCITSKRSQVWILDPLVTSVAHSNSVAGLTTRCYTETLWGPNRTSWILVPLLSKMGFIGRALKGVKWNEMKIWTNCFWIPVNSKWLQCTRHSNWRIWIWLVCRAEWSTIQPNQLPP